MRILRLLLGGATAKPQPLATPTEVRERLADMVVAPEEAKPAVLGRRQIAKLREIASFRELYDASQDALADTERNARYMARHGRAA